MDGAVFPTAWLAGSAGSFLCLKSVKALETFSPLYIALRASATSFVVVAFVVVATIALRETSGHSNGAQFFSVCVCKANRYGTSKIQK